MKFGLLIIGCMACLSGSMLAQSDSTELVGVVSFQNSRNVYVKFRSTERITVGDTLYVIDNGLRTPALVVDHKSSISCVCTPLGDRKLQIDDQVVYVPRVTSPPTPDRIVVPPPEPPPLVGTTPQEAGPDPDELQESVPDRSEQIKGRLSVSYYGTMSDREGYDRQRMRYTGSFRGYHLGESRLSLESYVSYRHTLTSPTGQRSTTDALKVYNLAVGYEAGNRSTLWLGRRYNPNVSNIGAIDGLQFETTFDKVVLGGFAGTRPDHFDYGFNPDLIQYGAFVRHDVHLKHGVMRNTLSLVEQRNASAVDRRFAYFQHTSNPGKKLFVFTSFDLELYTLKDGIPSTAFNLSSVYFSLRYRASRKLSVFTSYDARNNVIYYETYRNFVDQLIEEETRQGFRARINYRPAKYLTIGASAGYRFQKDNPNDSRNLRAYLTHSRIPGIKASAMLSAILLQTAYLDGQVFGLRLNRDLIKGKLSGQVEGRLVRYQYINSELTLNQTIAGASLSWRLNRKTSFNVYYEGIFGAQNNRSNVHLRVIQRF